MPSKRVVTKKDGGEALWAFGQLMEIKLSSADSNGKLAVIEMTVPSGPMVASPVHVHPGDETIYVLEGSMRFHVGDDVVDVPAGAQLHIPRGTREWGENVTNEPARALFMYTDPERVDDFFREVGEKATSRTTPPRAKPDLAKIAAVAKKYRIEIETGAPPAEMHAPH